MYRIWKSFGSLYYFYIKLAEVTQPLCTLDFPLGQLSGIVILAL